MRNFDTIYKELKYYESFNNNPITLQDAIKSTNAYFAEVEIDLRERHDYDSRKFDFFIVCQNLNTDKWMRDNNQKATKDLKSRPFLEYLKTIHKDIVKLYS